MDRVVGSNKSKEEYIAEVKKKLNVLDLSVPEETQINAQWCIDSENGQEILVDLNTHKIIARKSGGKLLKPEGD